MYDVSIYYKQCRVDKGSLGGLTKGAKEGQFACNLPQILVYVFVCMYNIL